MSCPGKATETIKMKRIFNEYIETYNHCDIDLLRVRALVTVQGSGNMCGLKESNENLENTVLKIIGYL